MKAGLTEKFHRILISVLIALSVFVFVSFTGGAFSYAGDDTGTDSEEDLASGVYCGAPWRLTSDYEFILGEEGKEYTIKRAAGTTFPEWHSVTIQVNPVVQRTVCFEAKKVTVAGTVHASGSLRYLFRDFQKAESIDLSGLETSGATSMFGMFESMLVVKDIDLSGLDTSNCEDMTKMFGSCRALKEIDVSGFNTDKVYSIAALFSDCRSLQTADISTFNVDKMISFEQVFRECTSLESVNMEGCTPKPELMNQMFYGCTNLTEIDISGFDTRGLLSDFDGEIFMRSGVKRLALGADTVFAEPVLYGSIKRYKTLDGEAVDGPTYTDINQYDGSAPGWYYIGSTSGSSDPGTGNDPGTGGNVDPGAGSNPGTGNDPGTGGSEDSGTDGSGSDGSGTGKTDGGTVTEPQTVVRKAITGLSLKKLKYVYTGKRIKPAVSVKCKTSMLRKGADYTVSYRNNKAVGKATVTVTGRGRFKGTLSRTFRIVPDRPRVRASTFRIIEGTQIKISVKSKAKPKYYELVLAGDPKCRKIIARKKLGKKSLVSGKIFAYTHLKRGRTYYVKVRLIAKNGSGSIYSKTVRIKGRG